MALGLFINVEIFFKKYLTRYYCHKKEKKDVIIRHII